jgi:NAD(P)H-flavin reductase/cytochrome b involved in lipid metabolism
VDVPTLFKALAPTHATLGSCLLILAPFQMVSGMRRYWGEGSPEESTYYAIIVIWAFIFTFLEVRKYRADQKAKSQDKPNPFISDEALANLKLMTWESVVTGCLHDAEWIVIRNICYDVRSWRAAHPGGQGRLTQMFGHDATEVFINGPHAHSSTAWRKMASLAVGRLDPREREEAHKKNDAFMFQLLTVTQVETTGTFKRITCATPLQMRFAKPGLCMPEARPARVTAAPTHEHKSMSAAVGITAIVNLVETGAQDLAARLGMGERKEGHSADRQIFIFPGQYCSLKAATQDEQAVRQLERPYTPFHSGFVKSDAPPPLARVLSSLPKGPVEKLDFMVKIYKLGKMSKFIENLKVGAQISVRGPMGEPVINPHAPDGRWATLFLLAGGSGITPMLQFMHYHMDYEEDNPNNNPMKWPVIHLVWCLHEPTNLVSAKLAELESRSRGRLKITTVPAPSGDPSMPGLARPAFERVTSGQGQGAQMAAPVESAKLTLRTLELVFEQTFDFVCTPVVPASPPASPKSTLTTPLLPSGSPPRGPPDRSPPSLTNAASLTGGSSSQPNVRQWDRLFGKDSTKVLVCGPPGFTEAAGEFSRTILGPEIAKSVVHVL